MVLLALYLSWGNLVFARLMLGVSTALATTAGTAYMTEILGEKNARRAALFVISATSLGFGGGALATSICLAIQGATFVPVIFVTFITIFSILALLAFTLPRVDEPKNVSLLRLPSFRSNLPSTDWGHGPGW
ncbi:MAG: hypothetical protein QNJ43_07475 [Breoghania sp.]|nr:hypothetical protein [Breoghania sp.]MDJ0930697.1 hypothetical protein [Breoghania sp.]